MSLWPIHLFSWEIGVLSGEFSLLDDCKKLSVPDRLGKMTRVVGNFGYCVVAAIRVFRTLGCTFEITRYYYYAYPATWYA